MYSQFMMHGQKNIKLYRSSTFNVRTVWDSVVYAH